MEKTSVYGYIRVSSRDQNEDRQRIALREAGVAPEDIYLDKQSGKDFHRPRYRQLLTKEKGADIVEYKSENEVALFRQVWESGTINPARGSRQFETTSSLRPDRIDRRRLGIPAPKGAGIEDRAGMRYDPDIAEQCGSSLEGERIPGTGQLFS